MLLDKIFSTPSMSDIQWGYAIAGFVALGIALISVVSFIVFAIKKHKKPKRISLVLAVIFICTYLFSGTLLSLSNTGEFGWLLDPDVGFEHIVFIHPFENEKGREVVYDLKGNEYTYRQYKNGFMYYSSDGKEYRLTTIDEDEQSQKMECLNTGEVFNIPSHMAADCDMQFLINEKGFLIRYDDAPPLETTGNDVCLYYYDDDGNLYFDWNLIQWDKDGKIYCFDHPIEEFKVENKR